MYDIQTYRTDDDEEPYVAWLGALPDRQAKARIVVRVNRMAGGNLGDIKPVGTVYGKPALTMALAIVCTTRKQVVA